MFSVQVFAADGATGEGDKNSSESDAPSVEAEEEIDYTTQLFATPEAKIAAMRLAFENKELGYQLYVDDYSGEVACVNTITGEKLFTNPYDVGASTGDATTKSEILSQIIVSFKDNQGQEKTFTSYRAEELLKPIFVSGKLVYPRYTTKEIRDYCASQIATLWDEVTRFENPHNYYVDLSKKLWDIKHELLKAK